MLQWQPNEYYWIMASCPFLYILGAITNLFIIIFKDLYDDNTHKTYCRIWRSVLVADIVFIVLAFGTNYIYSKEAIFIIVLSALAVAITIVSAAFTRSSIKASSNTFLPLIFTFAVAFFVFALFGKLL